MESPVISARLPPVIVVALDETARAVGLTRSDVILAALESFVAGDAVAAAQSWRAERLRRALRGGFAPSA